MTEFERVLMRRDDLTVKEAQIQRQEASKAVHEILDNGGSYNEVEDMLAVEYGLEMDFVMDLI